MPLTEEEQKVVLDRQVQSWKAEMAKLANQIAFARGTSCAVVLIEGGENDYADIHRQLVLEDALRVNPNGWPANFSFTLLNSPD